jgi:hypothetical protein
MLTSARLTLSCLLCAYASAATAANLVTNSDFNTDVSGWTPIASGTILSWDGSDGSPSPPLGSAHVTNTGSLVAGSAVSSCMVISTQNIDFFANVKIDAGSGGHMDIAVFNDATCTSGPGSISPLFVAVGAGWQPLSQSDFALPPGTQSAQVEFVGFTDSSNNLDAHFDHVLFGPTVKTPVRLQAFDVK